MEQDKEKEATKGTSAWLWIVIVAIVILVGLGIWFFTREDSSTTITTETKTTSVAPKHADWQKFTSSKYGFTMYYPADYILAESAVGTVTLSKGANVMVDLYVTVASTSGDPVAAAIAPYMDDTRGYMTGAAEVDTTVTKDAIEATMVTGTLGAKAGITSQAGKKGSTIFFVKNGNLFALDSFYNNNTADFQIFEDILADLRF